MGLDEFYNLLIERLGSIDGITTMKLSRKDENDCHMISVQCKITKKELLKIELDDSDNHQGFKNIHISSDHRTNEYGLETFTIGNQDIEHIHAKSLLALEKLVISKKTEHEYEMLNDHIRDPKYFKVQFNKYYQYIEEIDISLKVKGRNNIIDSVL